MRWIFDGNMLTGKSVPVSRILKSTPSSMMDAGLIEDVSIVTIIKVSRNLAEIEDDGQHCTDTVERPGRTHTVHQRFDNGRHGIGLRSGQLLSLIHI